MPIFIQPKPDGVNTELIAVTNSQTRLSALLGKHAFNDEQALLARVRYNRLVDIFTGVTCYSLQNHLRTAVPEMGQVERMKSTLGWTKRARSMSSRFKPKAAKTSLALFRSSKTSLSAQP